MSQYENDVPLNLAESSIKQLRLSELLDMAEDHGMNDIRRRLEQLVLTYDETPGSLDLREQLAALYGVGADEVLVTNGAIEANYLVFQAVIEPGDAVVAVFPAYQQLYEVARALGAEVRLWKLRYDEGFKPSLDDLKSLIDEKTRLIVLNTPHNPTGAALGPDELQQIMTWAREVGARVLCDETYQDIRLGDDRPLAPAVRTIGDWGISVSTVSKNLGLAGLRIGWIVSTPEFTNQCWALRDYSSISCSRLSDFLAVAAIRLRTQLLERSRKIARRNLTVLKEFMLLNSEHFDMVEPEAGLLTFPHLNQFDDSRQFCRELIEREGVLLVPGWAFEMEPFFRLGFGEDSSLFEEGLERIGRFVKGS